MTTTRKVLSLIATAVAIAAIWLINFGQTAFNPKDLDFVLKLALTMSVGMKANAFISGVSILDTLDDVCRMIFCFIDGDGEACRRWRNTIKDWPQSKILTLTFAILSGIGYVCWLYGALVKVGWFGVGVFAALLVTVIGWRKYDMGVDHPWRIGWVLLAAVLTVSLIIGYGMGAQSLRAKEYAEILGRRISVGAIEDIPDADHAILIDSTSAIKIGGSKVGAVEKSSQFAPSVKYYHLSVDGTPLMAAPLEYGGLAKWAANRDDGIPGFIKVETNPGSIGSEYAKFSDGGMAYVNTAYAQDDIMNRLRREYPTKLIETAHFEPDDGGRKWWCIAPVYDYVVGLYGGKDIIGAIIANPTVGQWHSQYYDLQDIPWWVDCIYGGDLLWHQYNWYGKWENGYINSLKCAAQKGCTEIHNGDGLDDYSRFVRNNDVWICAGVSPLEGGSSNRGFVVGNERTGEVKYIQRPAVSAWAAMSVMEEDKVIKERDYHVSFPSYVRLPGNGGENSEAYLGAIRGDSGIPEWYYVVSLEQVTQKAIAPTPEEAIQSYLNGCNKSD